MKIHKFWTDCAHNADGEMAFTPEEIEQGYLNDFINLLIKMHQEFIVWDDGYCRIVGYFNRKHSNKRAVIVDWDEMLDGAYDGTDDDDEQEAA